jgi:hypothetical protein
VFEAGKLNSPLAGSNHMGEGTGVVGSRRQLFLIAAGLASMPFLLRARLYIHI